MTQLTRRSFLGGMVTLVCSAPVLGCDTGGAPDAGPDASDATHGWPVPVGTTLGPARYAILCAAMDAMIPGAGARAGAVIANAPWYLDQLLGAFDVDPPRIFAGGPYSGRHGGPDGFSSFQRLTRIEELSWRTMIEGSRGIAEREWNGPVVGLRERYETGLDALELDAQSSHGRPFAALAPRTRVTLVQSADASFARLVYEHAVEGTYGDPVYGGNEAGAGWLAIDYEGDRQPIGYTARQMARPEEG